MRDDKQKETITRIQFQRQDLFCGGSLSTFLIFSPSPFPSLSFSLSPSPSFSLSLSRIHEYLLNSPRGPGKNFGNQTFLPSIALLQPQLRTIKIILITTGYRDVTSIKNIVLLAYILAVKFKTTETHARTFLQDVPAPCWSALSH